MAYFITDKCVGCDTCAKICPISAVSGEKKKLHVINESVCIECGACGKLCPKSAIEDAYGIVIRKLKKSLWPKPEFHQKLCMACVICIETCPTQAIQLGEPDAKDPHAYPVLTDLQKCISCGFCETECPADAVQLVSPEEIVEV